MLIGKALKIVDSPDKSEVRIEWRLPGRRAFFLKKQSIYQRMTLISKIRRRYLLRINFLIRMSYSNYFTVG